MILCKQSWCTTWVNSNHLSCLAPGCLETLLWNSGTSVKRHHFTRPDPGPPYNVPPPPRTFHSLSGSWNLFMGRMLMLLVASGHKWQQYFLFFMTLHLRKLLCPPYTSVRRLPTILWDHVVYILLKQMLWAAQWLKHPEELPIRAVSPGSGPRLPSENVLWQMKNTLGIVSNKLCTHSQADFCSHTFVRTIFALMSL